jgi:hypothetical protein
VVLYGCKILSLTLREEHRLRMIVNKVLRRIFGPKIAEVTAEWRKLHNEELRDLCCSTSIIRIINLNLWCLHPVACMKSSTQRYYGRFYYLLLTYLLHASVVRPSSSRRNCVAYQRIEITVAPVLISVTSVSCWSVSSC